MYVYKIKKINLHNSLNLQNHPSNLHEYSQPNLSVRNVETSLDRNMHNYSNGLWNNVFLRTVKKTYKPSHKSKLQQLKYAINDFLCTRVCYVIKPLAKLIGNNSSVLETRLS